MTVIPSFQASPTCFVVVPERNLAPFVVSNEIEAGSSELFALAGLVMAGGRQFLRLFRRPKESTI
jgi:hypothetical protein